MKTLLLGLGRANLAVAEYLVKKGEEVFVYDENLSSLAARAQKMIDEGNVKLYFEQRYDLAITSPGFPPNKAICTVLKDQGTPIIDEIEYVFTELDQPRVIAVTGTNGKSTTAALISSILGVSEIGHFLGGNLAPGKPFSTALFHKPYDYYVLEISSFQLMRIDRFRPHIAVLTNIGVDHLNWHKDFTEYRNAKLRVFANQGHNDFAVLNSDDEGIRRLADIVESRVVFFGHRNTEGVSLNGQFRYDGIALFANTGLPLPGEHNLMNMAAAIAVAKILQIDTPDIERGIMVFKSLPHRMEDLGLLKGIRYINNSMCTNATAAIASFLATAGSKIVIFGGRHKGDEGQDYLDTLIESAKACVVLGENASFIADYFCKRGYTKYVIAEDMTDAVAKARAFAQTGDTIILNPGFSSFDHFGNFEERGEAFIDAARQD
ncbi:MAG: UDP-N-acetylmuramoyl-L-alanine--D-glutamate ligase [candidate division WOR-3 bacterium]|nr:UDP-N-acetylmuramoyl-L-alanine--D-glutamate ligase [candidate division WOR-3 bacterium]